MKKRTLCILIVLLTVTVFSMLPTRAYADDGKTIRSVSISIVPPAAGNKPNYSLIFPMGAHYYSADYSGGNYRYDVMWKNSSGDAQLEPGVSTFSAGKGYTVIIYLTASGDYEFDSGNVSATVNGVSVEATKSNEQLFIEYAFPSTARAAGKAGDNFVWALDNDGTLTLTTCKSVGMADYTSDYHPEWSAYADYVKQVVIEEGITSIGDRAFYESGDYNSLTSVSIPDSVTRIGESAFDGCVALKSVTIPDGVTSVEDCAFYRCVRLESVSLGKRLRSIGNLAFAHCDKLTGVTIPSGVRRIGDNAFYLCTALKSYSVSPNNLYFCSADGVLFNKTKTELISYPCAKEGAFYTVPSTVKSIGYGAIDFCSCLREVRLPAGVTNLEPRAFFDNPNLADVVLPAGVTRIGKNAFGYCMKLKDVYYGGTEAQWKAIEIEGGGELDALPAANIHCNSGGLNGWRKFDGDWYFLGTDGAAAVGWVKDAGKWYYMNASGVMQTGWQKIAGKWYYLNSEMKTGWQKVDGKWYYLGTDGVMVTGKVTVDGLTYTFGANGVWDGKAGVKNGWVKTTDGKWNYYADGVKKTGWAQVSGKWYYLGADGVMQTGWKQVSGKWYYLGTDGVMQTGWKQVSGKWYYLGTDGAMKTGWQQVSGKWYYLNGDGTMKTGWHQQNGCWYYLKTGGAMAAGETLTINGKSYVFNASGVCANP